MSRLGSLLDALSRSGGREMRLAAGEPISVLRGASRQNLSREPVHPDAVAAVAAELVGAEAVARLDGEPLRASVARGGVAFEATVARIPNGLAVSIRPASEAEPPPPPPAATAAAPAPASTERPPAASATHAVDGLLETMVARRASDLHVSAGAPPVLRIDGDVVFLEGATALSSDDVARLVRPIMPEDVRRVFDERRDADFAYEIAGLARFRVNVFVDRRGVGAVFRQIPVEILSAETLGLPKAVLDLCRLTKGLVVVTGPTGSGKSTTLAAMIDFINRTRSDHILTIEDPIEFVHENVRCLVNQREVGRHTASFEAALRAALREDPDVVMVGEMRDLETIAIAIETAETGHLVLGTLHTTTAIATVDRIIDQFPPDQQEQIRVMLADSLKGVVAQVLCKKKGGGRVAALEILLGTPAVASLVREGKTFQIASVMQTSKRLGMVTMNDSLASLVKQGLVEPREAWLKATDKTGLAAMLRAAGVAADLD